MTLDTVNEPQASQVDRPLAGIRVVEVASWLMVPTAGAVLADWGAEVVKVEHPRTGDPLRGLSQATAQVGNNANVPFHHANRRKQSIALDVSTPEGRSVLSRMVKSADVFMTNFLGPVRAKLKLEIDDIRADNPSIIYARGSAVGPHGPERDRGGYDFASFWCRAGIAEALHVRPDDFPPQQPGGQGDTLTAAILAGGVSAALLKRERTGMPSVVDASLLATGAWMMGAMLAAAASGQEFASQALADRMDPPNPLVNLFRTRDSRYLGFCILQAERGWPEFCERIGQPQMVADPLYCDTASRKANAPTLMPRLDAIFAAATLEEWVARLTGSSFVWEVAQTLDEVAVDPQVRANGYVAPVQGAEGSTAPPYLVATPAMFDQYTPPAMPAPEHGQNTEEVLLDLGFSWEEIIQFKDNGTLL